MRKLLRKLATNKKGSEIVQQVIIIGTVVVLAVFVTAWITKVIHTKTQEAADKVGVQPDKETTPQD